VMVDTYRRLKTLRSKFEELVGTVGKIGQQAKAVRCGTTYHLLRVCCVGLWWCNGGLVA
jgi:hypothetical protein